MKIKLLLVDDRALFRDGMRSQPGIRHAQEHVAAIYQTLHVNSRSEAVETARRFGFIADGES